MDPHPYQSPEAPDNELDLPAGRRSLIVSGVVGQLGVLVAIAAISWAEGRLSDTFVSYKLAVLVGMLGVWLPVILALKGKSLTVRIALRFCVWYVVIIALLLVGVLLEVAWAVNVMEGWG